MQPVGDAFVFVEHEDVLEEHTEEGDYDLPGGNVPCSSCLCGV